MNEKKKKEKKRLNELPKLLFQWNGISTFLKQNVKPKDKNKSLCKGASVLCESGPAVPLL